MKAALLAKSALNLDWVEKENATSRQVWLCWSTEWYMAVTKDVKGICACVGIISKEGFSSVYSAMKWAESVWMKEVNGN